jgi:hypothetical protein
VKKAENERIDTVLLHTPRPRALQQQQQEPTMTTEQNYYIAFHSVIAVDMEKERKKEKIKDLSKMFVAKINCFHCPARVSRRPPSNATTEKKNVFGGRGERKRKTRLGQHPVAACPPEPGNNHPQKKKKNSTRSILIIPLRTLLPRSLGRFIFLFFYFFSLSCTNQRIGESC